MHGDLGCSCNNPAQVLLGTGWTLAWPLSVL
jgi:hypothetical protein